MRLQLSIYSEIGQEEPPYMLAAQSLALGWATCRLPGSTFCPTSLHHTGLSKALGVVTTAW